MTELTIQQLTIQQRNAQMVRRYAEGETLDSIGKDWSLTRERVRQIVTQKAGVMSGKARAVRAARKTFQTKRTKKQFMDEFGDFALMASIDGMTLEETVELILSVNDTVDPKLATEALRKSGFSFNKIHTGYAFPDELIFVGFWYLLGKKLDLKPKKLDKPTNQELAAIRLHTGLGETNATNRQVMEIVSLAQAAEDYAKANPTVTISTATYTRLRKVAEADLGIVAERGDNAWPATSQTTIKRFGGWNEFLASMGLKVGKGRPKGLVKFTEADYLQSMKDYLGYEAGRGVRATAEGYQKWRKEQEAVGAVYPHQVSIRNFYLTWNNAVRAAKGLEAA